MEQTFYTPAWAYDLSNQIFTEGEVYDNLAIEQSIENILGCGYGERIFFPSFGSPLPGLLFESMTESTLYGLLDKIIESVSQFENRITIIQDRCTMIVDPDNNTLDIKLYYKVNETNTIESFERRISK